MNTILSTWKEPGELSLSAAWQKFSSGGSMIDALEAGLTAAELDTSLIAIGKGSLPNQDGELELDASIMDGKDLNAGAVCALRGIVPAISVARKVMEETPHVMLAGDQARRFALSRGFEVSNLLTAECLEWFEAKKKEDGSEVDYVHALAEIDHGDTVTMLGRESNGHVVAASSTSGLSYKLPGRVGDSPIIGAGIYADDEVGCAGATGWGEELWKMGASLRVVEGMRSGLSAQEACEAAIRHMMRRQPNSIQMMSVVLAISKDGDYGAACNTGEFPLWVCQEGKIWMETRKGLSEQ
jgi:N4-(beta-N-acetylglucosaminyl)-L-asparaginase